MGHKPCAEDSQVQKGCIGEGVRFVRCVGQVDLRPSKHRAGLDTASKNRQCGLHNFSVTRITDNGDA